MRPARDGFTLVEVAVVLAIIGLIVGGILGGQAILRNAELNKIITDVSSYRNAVRQFKQQYGYLPGDFPTATQIWGRADGGTPLTSNCATPKSDNVVPTATCNGSGDGDIDYLFSGSAGDGTEMFRFWQHLKLAGFISTNVTGTTTASGSYTAVVGTNVPAGPLVGSMYYVLSGDTASFQSNFFGATQQRFLLSAYDPTVALPANAAPTWGIVRPSRAARLDKKFDDGFPDTGTIQANNRKNIASPAGTVCTNNFFGAVRPIYQSNDQTVATGFPVGCIMVFADIFSDPL